jgi:hypothetical protein
MITPLADGKILFSGSINPGTNVKLDTSRKPVSITYYFLYDSFRQQLIRVNSSKYKHYNYNVALLGNNNVLFTGGMESSDDYTEVQKQAPVRSYTWIYKTDDQGVH